MKIKRNKFLTTVKIDEVTMKMPTEKFDDIVGPDIQQLVLESKQNVISPNNSIEIESFIEINGVSLREKDLEQFSDMRMSILSSSMAKASSIYINNTREEINKAISNCIISCACSILGGTFDRRTELPRKQRIGQSLVFYNKITRINPELLGAEYFNWRGLQQKIVPGSRTMGSSVKIVEEVGVAINHMPELYYNGNKITIPLPTLEEVLEVFSNEVKISQILGNGWILLTKNILFKITPWKYMTSGILCAQVDGKDLLLPLRDISVQGKKETKVQIDQAIEQPGIGLREQIDNGWTNEEENMLRLRWSEIRHISAEPISYRYNPSMTPPRPRITQIMDVLEGVTTPGTTQSYYTTTRLNQGDTTTF